MEMGRNEVEPVGGELPRRAVDHFGDRHAVGPMGFQLQKDSVVTALKNAILAIPEIQIVQHVLHHFAPGVYARQWFSDVGEVTVGKRHKKETINILCAGKVAVSMLLTIRTG